MFSSFDSNLSDRPDPNYRLPARESKDEVPRVTTRSDIFTTKRIIMFRKQSDTDSERITIKDAHGMSSKGKSSILLRQIQTEDTVLSPCRSLHLFRFDLLRVRVLYLNYSNGKRMHTLSKGW